MMFSHGRAPDAFGRSSWALVGRLYSPIGKDSQAVGLRVRRQGLRVLGHQVPESLAFQTSENAPYHLAASAVCVKPCGQMTPRQIVNVDALKATSVDFTNT